MTPSLSRKLRILGFCVVLLLGLQGCSLIAPFVVPKIDIPPAPTLQVCPERPELQGKIVELEDGSQGVLLTMETARALSAYLSLYRFCAETNVLELEGYIEKLVNRLKAVSGNAE